MKSIAAVEGVDGIFIGPSDLAADLGHLGNPGHPDVQAAIAAAGAPHTRRRQSLRHPHQPTPNPPAASSNIGFTFVAAGSDVGVLARGTATLAALCKEKLHLHTSP